MNKVKYFLLAMILGVGHLSNGQDLNLFLIYSNGFISLSDIDDWRNVDQATILPSIDRIENGTSFIKGREIEITGQYRDSFLRRTKLQKSDSLFAYSFLNNKLVSFPISNLKTYGVLSDYMYIGDCPCRVSGYQLGFKVDLDSLADFEQSFTHTLVYVGPKNPFVKNQLKKMSWTEIPPAEFPSEMISEAVNYHFGHHDSAFSLGNSFKFQGEYFSFHIQRLMKEEYQFGLRLIVTDLVTNDKKFEKVYYGGESASFAHLKYQWTGNLFKDRPPVVFGFQHHAFGCPGIDFISAEESSFWIKCDNRH